MAGRVIKPMNKDKVLTPSAVSSDQPACSDEYQSWVAGPQTAKINIPSMTATHVSAVISWPVRSYRSEIIHSSGWLIT
jgi:hypothetical protein